MGQLLLLLLPKGWVAHPPEAEIPSRLEEGRVWENAIVGAKVGLVGNIPGFKRGGMPNTHTTGDVEVTKKEEEEVTVQRGRSIAR